jgi:parvulin-like peptidyl-prolyl isomerase
VRVFEKIVLLVALLALTLCSACGGAQASADANSSANVAARATEPRANDPTGSRPAPMLPTPGQSAKLGGSQAPASPTTTTGSAKPPTDPALEMTPGGAPSSTKRAAEPPTKISARHVLIQWMGADRAAPSIVRSRDQARAVAEQVLKQARAGDDFARLAIEFSDEPGAGGRGGSLGRFGRGQMDGRFEAAAFKLDVGQISDIVESGFGFHIIQRTE